MVLAIHQGYAQLGASETPRWPVSVQYRKNKRSSTNLDTIGTLDIVDCG